LLVSRYGEGHCELADVPDEPRKFACDGYDSDVHILAACCQFAVSAAESDLCVPGTVKDAFGNAFMSALDLRTHACRVSVAPGGLDEQLRYLSSGLHAIAGMTSIAGGPV